MTVTKFITTPTTQQKTIPSTATTRRWWKSKIFEPKLYLPSTIRQKDKRMKNCNSRSSRSG